MVTLQNKSRRKAAKARLHDEDGVFGRRRATSPPTEFVNSEINFTVRLRKIHEWIRGRQSIKRVLTDSSVLMRRMVSASMPATVSCRMRGQARASGRSGMVSVTTSSSNTEDSMFLIAAPDNTGCVQ